MVCSIILTAVDASLMAAAYMCMHAMALRCIAATARHGKVHNVTGSETVP